MTPFAGSDAMRVLVAGMKTAGMNHRFIANNIANAETPHYNPVHLDFDATLKGIVEGRGGIALRTTRPRHFDLNSSVPNYDRQSVLSRNDLNKVDLDQALLDLASNRGRFEMYARLVAKKYEQLSGAFQALNRT